MDGWAAVPPGEIPSPGPVAAWLRLGLVPPERIPLWAAHWLATGHDGDALVLLAGYGAREDPRDIRALLPDALADCGVTIPGSDAAAAQAVFTHLAHLQTDGLAGERWILDKVTEIAARSEYAVAVISLPLGRIFGLDDEWDARWGRSEQELRAIIRQACAAQLATGYQPHD